MSINLVYQLLMMEELTNRLTDFINTVSDVNPTNFILVDVDVKCDAFSVLSIVFYLVT